MCVCVCVFFSVYSQIKTFDEFSKLWQYIRKMCIFSFKWMKEDRIKKNRTGASKRVRKNKIIDKTANCLTTPSD